MYVVRRFNHFVCLQYDVGGEKRFSEISRMGDLGYLWRNRGLSLDAKIWVLKDTVAQSVLCT